MKINLIRDIYLITFLENSTWRKRESTWGEEKDKKNKITRDESTRNCRSPRPSTIFRGNMLKNIFNYGA